MEVLKNSVSKLFADWEEIKKGGRKAYLRKSDLGHDDGVHRAGSVPERLAGVTVRMVLVLVDLTVLIVGVPGHGALVDADVALGVDRGGLAAEVPITEGEKPAISLCILFWYVESWRQVLASNWEILFAVVGKAKKEGEYSPSSNQESTGHNTEEDLDPIRQELDHTQEHSSSVFKGPYVELRVTLGALLEVGLLHLGGTVESARRSTEERLAGKSPAGGHSSDRRHAGGLEERNCSCSATRTCGGTGGEKKRCRDDDVAGASSGDLPWARAESAGRASIIPFLFIIIDGALSNRRVSAVPDPCSGCLVMCEVCA